MTPEQSAACTADVLAFVRMGEAMACKHQPGAFWLAVAAVAAERAGLIERPGPAPMRAAPHHWGPAAGVAKGLLPIRSEVARR